MDRVKWGLNNDFMQYRYLNPAIALASNSALSEQAEAQAEEDEEGGDDDDVDADLDADEEKSVRRSSASNLSAVSSSAVKTTSTSSHKQLAGAAYSEEEDTKGFEALKSSLVHMGLSVDAVQQLLATLAGMYESVTLKALLLRLSISIQ